MSFMRGTFFSVMVTVKLQYIASPNLKKPREELCKNIISVIPYFSDFSEFEKLNSW